jgi:transcriptional regulator with XRE-family HTH domain
MSALAAKVGKAVRAARIRRGLSQEATAALAGINRNYLGEIERGEVSVSVSTLNQVANALGESLVTLLGENEQ